MLNLSILRVLDKNCEWLIIFFVSEKEYWLEQFERKMPDIQYAARILKALRRLPPATRITASYVWPPVLDSDSQFDVTSRKHGLTKRPFGNYFPNGNDEKNANLNLMSG